MATDAATTPRLRPATSLTEAHDRLLDIIAEELVDRYLAEVEAMPDKQLAFLDRRGRR